MARKICRKAANLRRASFARPSIIMPWGPHLGLPGWGTRKKYGLHAARRAPQFSKR